jgi:hypothetical protein
MVLLGPTAAQSFGEPLSLGLSEVGYSGRQLRPSERRGDSLVQFVVLVGCYVAIPVSTAHSVRSLKESFKEVHGGGVDHNLREVLAADEEDMIDPKINRGDFVTGGPVRSFPLNRDRPSAS